MTIDKHARIFVAGHRGMVGSALVRRLQAGGYTNILTRTRAELDLRDQKPVQAFLAEVKPAYTFIASTRTTYTAPTSSTRTCRSRRTSSTARIWPASSG